MLALGHVTLHTSHFTLYTSHFTLHTSHFTLHTSHFTLHTSHFTLHTSHVTRHTSHVTRHTSHVTRHTSHVTRHTSRVAGFLCQSQQEAGCSAQGKYEVHARSSSRGLHRTLCSHVLRCSVCMLLVARHSHHTSHIIHHASHITHHTSRPTLFSSYAGPQVPKSFCPTADG